MIAHHLSQYVSIFIYDDFIEEPFKELERFNDLDFNINKFSLNNCNQYVKEINEIDPLYLLYQFNYSLLRVFN